MKTFILSLGLVTALAGSAMAQSAYDDSASNIAAGGNSGVAISGGPNDFTSQGIDTTTTSSVSGMSAAPYATNSIVRNDPVNHPTIQRGNQGAYFGANGR